MSRFLWLLVAGCVAAGASLEYLAYAERQALTERSDPRDAVERMEALPQGSRSAFRIDIAGLLPKLDAVAVDDRDNQIADWVVYGILAEAGLGMEDLRAATFDVAPIRLPSLESTLDFDYGLGRRVAVASGEVWLIYNERDPRPRATLGRLADRVRMERGDELPPRFGVYKYRSALDEGAIYIEREPDVPTTDLFSEEYGYVEATVADAAGLREWLERADDLTHVRVLDDGRLRLGGRRFDDSRTLGATIDDVAALYQAHLEIRRRQEVVDGQIIAGAKPLGNAFDQLIDLYNANVERFNRDNFADLNPTIFAEQARDVERLLATGPSGGGASRFTSLDEQLRVIDALEPTVYQRIEELRQQAFLEALREGAVPPAEPGFSLDPQWNTERLLRDLVLLRDEPMRLVEAAFADLEEAAGGEEHPLAIRRRHSTARDVFEVMAELDPEADETLSESIPVADFQIEEDHRDYITSMLDELEGKSGRELEDGAILPFLQLLDGAEHGEDMYDARLSALLRHIESHSRAQCARYDGPLQGTRVGMNLFYTDLLAKLWASIDYYGTAPIDEILGFTTTPQSGYLLEANYWQEYWKFPSTRLWFGVKPEGFKSTLDGEGLTFADIATRVYSAGSNPLVPGEEELASEANNRVFDWWDRHYARVADYEQQYHLQNQIMKWSVVTGWLAERGLVTDLDDVPVTRDHRFDRWYAAEPDLRFKHDVRFLPTDEWLGNTECIEILRSYNHPSAGIWSAYVEGGVSLGSGRAVNTAARVSDDLPLALRRPGSDYELSQSGKISNIKRTTFDLPPAANDNALVRAVVPEGARLRAGGSAFDFSKLETRFRLDLKGGTVTLDADAASIGQLRWRTDVDGVRLTWRDGEAEITREALDGITASLQRSAGLGDDVAAAHLAADPALLPRTGHYVIHQPGEAVEVVAASGAGGRFGGPPPIRGPPRAGGSDGGAGDGRLPILIHISDDAPGAASLPKDGTRLASSAASSDFHSLFGLPPRRLEAALVQWDHMQQALDRTTWQRLRPLTRSAEDASGDVSRVFTTMDPPPQARAVTLRTSHPDLPSIEARWIEGELFLKRPEGARASRAFDDLVVEEGITSSSLQRLDQTLLGDPILKTLDFGGRVGERFGYEAAYWAERGDYDAVTRALRAAAEQGQLAAAATAAQRQAAARLGEGIAGGREAAAGRRLADLMDGTAPEARVALAVSRRERGSLDDAVADLETLKAGSRSIDPELQKSLRTAHGEDLGDYLRLRQGGYEGVPGEVVNSVRLERHGFRLATEMEIDALAGRPSLVTEHQRRLLIHEVEQTPPDRVYVQDKGLLAKLDWDGAPHQTLAEAMRDPRINWAIVDAEQLAEFRPSMLVDTAANRYVAHEIPQPRANPRPWLPRDLPPAPDSSDSCDEADDPFCNTGAYGQSAWTLPDQRMYLLMEACSTVQQGAAEGWNSCDRNPTSKQATEIE